jgi:predicted dehydrogenase
MSAHQHLKDCTMSKIKVGIIGIGDRGVSFVRNFAEFPDLAEIAGIYDTNGPRLEAMAQQHKFVHIPRYNDWREFVASTRHDLMLVTTPDDTHPDVISRCLSEGYHVFADKPLANSAQGLIKIMDAYDRSGRMLLMGFNVRYSNLSRKMKEIAQRGELGNIKVGVCFHPEQGIRYFRRWHKFRAKTNGLVIHKGCHQLDIMNWIIGSYPVEVYAQGGLAVYKGDKTVAGCHVCSDLPRCPYARKLDYASAQQLYRLYVDPSAVDGYHRNYCPISNDADVPDHYLVTIRYANGARASYTEIHFSGKSRVEWSFFGDQAEMAAGRAGESTVTRINHITGEVVTYDVPPSRGGHGGDPAMTLAMIVSVMKGRSLMPPPEAGVRSSAIGIAAMKSIDEGRPVRIEELLPLELLQRGPDGDLQDEVSFEALGYERAKA